MGHRERCSQGSHGAAMRLAPALLLLLALSQHVASRADIKEGPYNEDPNLRPPERRLLSEGWEGNVYKNPAAREYEAMMADPARRQLTTEIGGLRGGFVFVSTDDADDSEHCQGSRCGNLYANVIRRAYRTSGLNTTTNRMLAVGLNGNTASATLQGWLNLAGISTSLVDVAISAYTISIVNFNNYRLIYVPSSATNTLGGITQAQANALAARLAAIKTYVNERGGSMVVLTQQGLSNPYAFFPNPLTFVSMDFADVSVTANMDAISDETDSSNSDHVFWHGYFTGPINWGGIFQVLAYKTYKNDAIPSAGSGCPVMNGVNQDCRATLLGNMYTKLTALDCNNKFSTNAAVAAAARAAEECWRCGDGFLDPDEQCDAGNLLQLAGCSATCNIMPPSPPSPPSVIPYLPPSWNNTGNTYCAADAAGTVCQNCAGNCVSADRGGTNGDICILPRSMGGWLDDATELVPLDGGLLGRTVVYTQPVRVRYTTAAGVVSYATVGTMYIMLRRQGRITVTVKMNCPWMTWSTPSDPTNWLNDINQQLWISFSTNYSIGTVDRLLVPFTRPDFLARKSSYYSCLSWTATPVPTVAAGVVLPVLDRINYTSLSVRALINVNRVFARQNADDCVPDPDCTTGSDLGTTAGTARGDSDTRDCTSGTGNDIPSTEVCPQPETPDATTGQCSEGRQKVAFTGAPGDASVTSTYTMCVDSLVPQAAGIYSFSFCWNYNYMPADMRGKNLVMAANTLPVPQDDTVTIPEGSRLMNTFMLPSCVSTLAVKTSASGTNLVTTVGSNDVVYMPPTNISSVSYSWQLQGSNCSEKFVAVLITLTTPPADQPPVLAATCPCWDIPTAGVCPNITLPITLSTTGVENGVSYQQCIDPANFDYFTGQMAFSYCWRYKCLPDVFSKSSFTATMTDLSRFNIARMPGGVVYNSTIKATPGVRIEVTGKPKYSNESLVYFNNNGTALPNGDWVSGNVSLPSGGIGNLTFVYHIPMGFDDLSAAVVMEIIPGQTLPAVATVAPNMLCRCPSVPNESTGACADGTMLATVTRLDGVEGTAQQCLPLPQYDLIAKVFAFSTCWRYDCLPLAFRLPNKDNIKPYRITIRGINQYNIDRMPGTVGTLAINKPFAVNMSITANPALASENVTGPYRVSTANASLPTSISSFDVVIEVPGFPWLDSNSGSITITPGPSSTPPLVITSNVTSNSTAVTGQTIVTAQVYLLREVRNAAELASILNIAASDISANIDSYISTLPVGFSDFTAVPDCSRTSTFQFTQDVATALGISASSVSVTCRLGSSSDALRRRGRSLAQANSVCSNEAVQLTLQITTDPSAFTSGASMTASRQAALSNQYGSVVCGFGASSTVTSVIISQPKASGASLASQCTALTGALAVASSEVSIAGCSEILVESPSSGSGSGSGSKAAVGIGVGVGLGGAALLAVVVLTVLKIKRDRSHTSAYYFDDAASGQAAKSAEAEERKRLRSNNGAAASPRAAETIPVGTDDGAGRLAAAAAARRGLGAGGNTIMPQQQAPGSVSGRERTSRPNSTAGAWTATDSGTQRPADRPSSSGRINRVSPTTSSGGAAEITPRRGLAAQAAPPAPAPVAAEAALLPGAAPRSRLADTSDVTDMDDFVRSALK